MPYVSHNRCASIYTQIWFQTDFLSGRYPKNEMSFNLCTYLIIDGHRIWHLSRKQVISLPDLRWYHLGEDRNNVVHRSNYRWSSNLVHFQKNWSLSFIWSGPLKSASQGPFDLNHLIWFHIFVWSTLTASFIYLFNSPFISLNNNSNSTQN